MQSKIFHFLASTIFVAKVCASSLTEYQLYAPTVYTQRDKVVAEGGVVIYNKNSVFSAQKIVYDKKSSTLELFQDVYIDYNGNEQSKNDYFKISLKDKRYSGKKLFLADAISKLWIRSEEGVSYDKKYTLRDATLSSCNVDNPDWYFSFKKGFYNSNKQYVSLVNPTFYFKKVPIFYLPWFAFPTINKRTTGLLKPYIGFENSENLLFVQPFFINLAKNMDIEIDPQIRLDRGLGLYSTFRFVDTNLSKGELTLGIFDEQNGYVVEHKLKNRVHRGVNFKYQNSRLLSNYLDNKYHDGLLVDLTNLNDIDYLNLKHHSKLAVSKLVTSKINYYISDEDEYLGLYAKYFIDTEKLSNSDTLQTLPSFQYHKFVSTLFFNNILYSIDYKYKNSYRKRGLRAKQYEISIPITYSHSFFDDYMHFLVSENLYFSKVNYFDKNSSIQDANYFSNYHKFTISSDLSKKYDRYLHNMQISASYIVPSASHKHGYFAKFVPFNVEQKSIRFRFNEYLYDLSGFNFFIHRITQNIYLENKKNTLDDLENEVIYRFSKNFYFQNTLIYSYEYDKLKKIQSGLYYNGKDKSFRINHTYQKAPNLNDIDFLTADFSQKIDRHYEIFGGIDYDFDNDFTKEWRFGWRMRKRCWDYQLKFVQSITPNLTSAGAESVTRRGVYLLVRLANIGGVEIKSVRDYSVIDDNLLPKVEDENSTDFKNELTNEDNEDKIDGLDVNNDDNEIDIENQVQEEKSKDEK